MKVRRRLGTILFGLGCAAAFAGFMSLIMKNTENAQLQLVLQSFYTASDHAAVSLVNAGMVFCLSHAWQVLGAGGAAMLLGGILLWEMRSQAEPAPSVEVYRRPEEPVRPVPSSAVNPFAVAVWAEEEPAVSDLTFEPTVAQTNHSEPAVADFYKPLLDQNCIETPEAVSPFAKPEPAAEPSPVKAAEKTSASLSAPKALDAHPSRAALEPENLSPRIRSTMGKKR